MFKKITLISAIIFILSCSNCFSSPFVIEIVESSNTSDYFLTQDISSECRKVDKFSELNVSGAISVTYIQSNKSEVFIEGKQEFINNFISEVIGDKLYLKMKPGKYHNFNLYVTVYSPALHEVELSGSGSFNDMQGHKSGKDVKFKKSGSGKSHIGNLDCKDFKCSISGSGDMVIESLICNDADMVTNGSGNITIKNLKSCEDVEIAVSGSGHGDYEKVDITGDLELSISGSGSIKINGKANKVEANIAGSGTISGNLSYRNIDSHTTGSGRIRFY